MFFKKEESSMQALLQLNKRNLKIEKAKSAILFDKNCLRKRFQTIIVKVQFIFR